MSEVTKLGIGMATQGLCEARTAFSLATAMRYVDVPMQLFLGIGCYIHQNRDTVVRQALDGECSHLLFVDSDIMFNHDAILKLIADDKDIVGARYNKRITPIESTVKDDIKVLSEVLFVPSGFLLIDTKVFKKIGKPYFSFDKKSDSDDLYFCNKALAKGFKIWCDPTIPIGHLGTAIF
jgi:GT2 family glycosyltransferase